MHLTTFLDGSDHAEYTKNADLQKMKVSAMITRKVRADRNKLCTGEECMEAICPIVLALGRLLWSGKQMKIL